MVMLRFLWWGQLWKLCDSGDSHVEVVTIAIKVNFLWLCQLWQVLKSEDSYVVLCKYLQLCDRCISGELPVVGSLLPAPSPAPPVCLVQYSLQWELSTVSKTLFIHHTINNKPLSLFISARCSIPFNESLAQWVKHCKAILPSPIYHHHITLLHGAVFPSTRTQHSE